MRERAKSAYFRVLQKLFPSAKSLSRPFGAPSPASGRGEKQFRLQDLPLFGRGWPKIGRRLVKCTHLNRNRSTVSASSSLRLTYRCFSPGSGRGSVPGWRRASWFHSLRDQNFLPYNPNFPFAPIAIIAAVVIVAGAAGEEKPAQAEQANNPPRFVG